MVKSLDYALWAIDDLRAGTLVRNDAGPGVAVTSRSRRPRLAVISPFLDKRHGTERRVVEWVSRLADSFEIHIYSQHVEDLDLSKFTWHRIPQLPGPHILNFVWWIVANHLWRSWDQHTRGLSHDLIFSPGINCLDADAISVHIVFAEYVRQVGKEISLLRNPIWIWPTLLHRRLYYRLLVLLERRVYTDPKTVLILIARKTATRLERFYGRVDRFPVLYIGLDQAIFNPGRRHALRDEARRQLGLSETQFTLILVGNDWRNKGVPVLLDALTQIRYLPINLIIVSREDSTLCQGLIAERQLEDRVKFVPPRDDIEFYYSAADTYVGPSLEDTFAQPPAEAMACGLPVIVSSANGTSEIVTHGQDGLILTDPTDSLTLAGMIRDLYKNKRFRDQLGSQAARTALAYTWERNGRELVEIFREILRRKEGSSAQSVVEAS
jgi:glycosyltransferase involved in cell wall biosynthesis